VVRAVDLEFQGRPGVIAAGVVEAPGGLVIVDPGPASTVGRLLDGLAELGASPADVRGILVTHIHLDHSGAVGTLLRGHPRLPVHAHRRGVRHLIDPSKLLDSARLVFGDRTSSLWGDVLPVPAEAVIPLEGGEAVEVAGLEFRVAYTPGHASHHVSYLETASRTAFVGDTGGVRLPGTSVTLPPTPPPDIDLDAWDASLAAIRSWAPSRLFVTHFGAFDDPNEHLDDLQRRLHEAAGWVRELIDDPALDEAGRQAAFVRTMTTSLRQAFGDEAWVGRYERAMPLDHCWHGLARYWRKREITGPRPEAPRARPE
jgi:glyoxylase-like metal-dependent hydrolase (beta-lactamase superfamily II)